MKAAREMQSAARDKFDKELKSANLACEQFAGLSASKQNMQVVVGRMDELQDQLDSQLAKVGETLARAQQIAADTARQLEKQLAELKSLEQQAQNLEDSDAFEQKAQLAEVINPLKRRD